MNSKLTYLFMRGIIRFVVIIRSSFLSFLTLITVIFMYHVFFTAGTGTAGFLNHLSQANTIRVYLANNNDIIAEEILSSVKVLDNVTNAVYYSQKAAKEYAVAHAPKAAGLDSFSEEFFPSFIEVTPKDTESTTLDKIVDEASHISGVDQVSYGKEYMAKFKSISNGAWMFILTITILFGLSAVFVVYNTIKISLYTFKEEIKLYSLVGATRPFIAVPYLFGALFLSLFAFIFSYIIFAASFLPFNDKILIPSGINIYSMPTGVYFAVSCVIICIIGFFAAFASIVSFLRQVSSINDN